MFFIWAHLKALLRVQTIKARLLRCYLCGTQEWVTLDDFTLERQVYVCVCVHMCVCTCVCVHVFDHVWVCYPIDYSPPGFSVHGILQARILEWVAILTQGWYQFLCFGHLIHRQLTGLVPEAGEDWGQKGKRASEGEMAGWHHWCNGHELRQTWEDGEGQGGLACCSPWGCKDLDMTGLLNNNNYNDYRIGCVLRTMSRWWGRWGTVALLRELSELPMLL